LGFGFFYYFQERLLTFRLDIIITTWSALFLFVWDLFIGFDFFFIYLLAFG
jgi:hypothetical protein